LIDIPGNQANHRELLVGYGLLYFLPEIKIGQNGQGSLENDQKSTDRDGHFKCNALAWRRPLYHADTLKDCIRRLVESQDILHVVQAGTLRNNPFCRPYRTA